MKLQHWKKREKFLNMETKHNDRVYSEDHEERQIHFDDELSNEDGFDEDFEESVEKEIDMDSIDKFFERISDHVTTLKDDIAKTKERLAKTQTTVNTAFVLSILCATVLFLLCGLAGYFMFKYRLTLFPHLRNQRQLDNIHIESEHASRHGGEQRARGPFDDVEVKEESVPWRKNGTERNHTSSAVYDGSLPDIDENFESTTTASSTTTTSDQNLEKHLEFCKHVN